MSSAGFQLVAGRIPGERIATATETSDSSGFTAETSIATVTAALVTGRTYRVRVVTKIVSTVAADTAIVRVRENDASGNILTHALMETTSTSGFGWPIVQEAEYTAVSSADKTFAVTAARNSGTGNVRREASSNGPTYLYVDYIRG